MAEACYVTNSQDGITLAAYRGDGVVLLAFDLEQERTAHLAGFAVQVTPPNGQPSYILNRLNFSQPITNTTTADQRVWTPSNEAPIQKFRWMDFPANLVTGPYTYAVTAMYFSNGGITPGPSTSVTLNLLPDQPPFSGFTMGFTRGYLSSQAYAQQFHNAPIEPTPKSIDYDTGPYLAQYQWLGFEARTMVFDFLTEAINDPEITLDALVFDLDEPDVIRLLQQLGSRLRVFMDDADLHTKPGSTEIEARALFETSAGAANVKTGHFQRFAHCKVMIQKKNGTPVKVLTGSANFSIRGLYVQANNVLVFDDPPTAALYEQAFEQSFTNESGFAKSQIAQQWFDLTRGDLPPASVCFSPHTSPDISLDRVATAIQQAQSSVLYAIMELQGSGQVLDDIKALGSNPKIFGYGITQSAKGMTVYKPGAPNGVLTQFSFLQKQVPKTFLPEYSGGIGQVIHDKFVVVDFNGSNPWVFTGSSNLAAGGEESNGDNLLAINDPAVAVAYGVEAIRLVDHYDFRTVMQSATSDQPLTLKPDSANWWAPYYDPSTARCTERALLCRGVASSVASPAAG